MNIEEIVKQVLAEMKGAAPADVAPAVKADPAAAGDIPLWMSSCDKAR